MTLTIIGEDQGSGILTKVEIDSRRRFLREDIAWSIQGQLGGLQFQTLANRIADAILDGKIPHIVVEKESDK